MQIHNIDKKRWGGTSSRLAERPGKVIHPLGILAGLTLAFTLLPAAVGVPDNTAQAAQLFPDYYSTDGSACANISDADYFTTEYFDPGTRITISAQENIDSLYVVWENDPGNWTLEVNGTEYTYGGKGYLHEYVKLSDAAGGASEVTLVVGDHRITIADIYAFSSGNLPGFVQVWEPSYEEADVLLISTHADDEVLFFGGIIPNYIDRGDVRVQVAYFSDLFQSEPYRNHEILNGLWTMGVTHYPQLGEFYDYYSESFEEAQEQFNYNDGLEYIVKTLRRFKPQVVIGQDLLNGEYGHGGHMWCARLIADALDYTADAESFADSAREYGTWDVPKTYFHLYPENVIELNARIPLASFGGKTELEIAKEAYLEHKSQQWTWFYVSDGYDEDGNPDGYEYSCTRYGLYRSLVGDDFSGNDILDNIVTYDEQEKEAQRKAQEEAAALALEQEQAAQADDLPVDGASAQSVVNEGSTTEMPGGKNTTAITILIVAAVILLVMIVGIIVLSVVKKRERERRRAMQQRRRAYNQRTSDARVRNLTNESRQRSSYDYDRRASSNTSTNARRTSRSSNGTYRNDGSRRR